jgi:hypothetical protein
VKSSTWGCLRGFFGVSITILLTIRGAESISNVVMLEVDTALYAFEPINDHWLSSQRPH